jgi:TIR domain
LKNEVVGIMRIFLSYSPADEGFAKQLASDLSRRGCDVWDPGDQLFPGDNRLLKMGEALKLSKAMVVLLSPDSIKSNGSAEKLNMPSAIVTTKGDPILVRPTEGITWILRKFRILRADENPAEISKRIASALKRVA